jgi:uncharacterized membrane protein
LVKPAIFVLALSPLAAPFLADTHPLAALLLRDFFSHLCHQNPARSLMLEGSPIAVCIRCLGIYTGVALSTLRGPKKKPLAINLFFAAILLNLIDVVAETLHWHSALPLPRFFLGLSLGLATGSVLLGSTRAESEPATQAKLLPKQ